MMEDIKEIEMEEPITIVTESINGKNGDQRDLSSLLKSEEIKSTVISEKDSPTQLLASTNPNNCTGNGSVEMDMTIGREIQDLDRSDMESTSISNDTESSCSTGEEVLEVSNNEKKFEQLLKKETQMRACYKIHNTYKLARCRECVNYNNVKGIKSIGIVCRFASFRKIITRISGKGTPLMSSSGFCDPYRDPQEKDINLWLPSEDNPPANLDLELCKHLISQLGDQFCALIRQEMESVEIKKSLDVDQIRGIHWKKAVEGIREMCDVCATTVFNYHWNCDRCGFMACPECFETRRILQEDEEKSVIVKGRDGYNWLVCMNQFKSHKPQQLSLTQIIPGDVLDSINKTLHEVRNQWNIPQHCGCPEVERCLSLNKELNLVEKMSSSDSVALNLKTGEENIINNGSPPPKKSKLEDDKDNSSDSESTDEEDDGSFFKSLFKPGNTSEDNDSSKIRSAHQNKYQLSANLKEIPAENKSEISEKVTIEKKAELKHFVRAHKNSYYDKAIVPVKMITHADSKSMCPSLPHNWLCSGTLLRLTDPFHEDNYTLFKDVWMRGQPVLVSNVGTKLNQEIWSPAAFDKDFGQQKNDLVNCMTGKVVPSQLMKDFWDGFIDFSKRLKDENGDPMLLKLKDWPPGDDFAKILPERFNDLMSALPLKEYTHRTGRLNLAARLPENFTRPDLGPKMYIAYGDGNHLDKGTTNLHLDISDAVNVMVHVGIPTLSEIELGKHNEAVLNAIEESDCCQHTINRVKNGPEPELPGALWHIYRPWDADKIRDLINKVSVKDGHAIEPNHDPIHDQVVYLDKNLRKRLREEYDVVGFPIVQCKGDAVFIPAGAPHQVRNLQNCIKIAEDFVSPENVSHCFQLTEEFRKLSDTHSNHEDKLQIKNIVYHAVKDALSVLLHLKKFDQK